MKRSVLVTGASRGIGRAVALLAAERGYRVDIMGRSSERMDETLAHLEQRGAAARLFECDLVQRAQVDVALRRLGEGPPPDLVIHNAARVERAILAEQTDQLWDASFELNVTAPMRITRALLPGMLAVGSGRILFVSSISAILGTRAQSAYNASKAALVALMRCLAEELSETQLMTAALLPGSVDTDMLAGSGFEPRMAAKEVAQTLLYYGFEASRAHNGAVIEMFGI